MRGRLGAAVRRLGPWPDRAPQTGKPTSSVLICGMPRTGTAFLSGLLASTGRVGLADEWFDPQKEPPGVTDYRAFVDGVVGGCARDVFGVKFVGNQLWSFIARLRSAARSAGLSDRALVEQALPEPRFVWLTRDDTIAQAVSLWRAGKTNRWWVAAEAEPASPSEAPSFDFREIQGRVAGIVRGTESWERWFDANGVEPYRLAYEELDASPVEATRGVLAYLGVVVPGDAAIVAQSSRQSDALNREWIARYRSLASPVSPPGETRPGA